MPEIEKELKVTSDRIDTPAFHRNHPYIIEVLKSELRFNRGNILEIASGSGQHAMKFANTFPKSIFWPSDLNSDHIRSIEAWKKDVTAGNLKSPFRLDVLAEDWGIGESD